MCLMKSSLEVSDEAFFFIYFFFLNIYDRLCAISYFCILITVTSWSTHTTLHKNGNVHTQTTTLKAKT